MITTICTTDLRMLRQNTKLIKEQSTIRTSTNNTNLFMGKKVPCSRSNFDQPISIDTEGTARYRVTPYPVKVETKLNTISPDEIELDNMFSKASVIESGIYSKEQPVQGRNEIYYLNICEIEKNHCKKQPQQLHKNV